MKRFMSIFAVAALVCQAAFVFAQDSDEPSIESVLDAARAKYWQDVGPDSESSDSESSEDDSSDDSGLFEAEGPDADDDVPYTPFLISLVPGVTIPFGYYDASFVAGPIGNISRDVTGAEGAGVFNISRDARGFQGAGVFNIARRVLGFQGAGVFNLVEGDAIGFQSSGVFNIVDGTFSGFQSAGVFNIAGTARTPLQCAGVFNIVDEIYGFQGAGVFNIAERVAGGQVAGVFNAADYVTGIQIGLVNVADHIDGVQLGLVNIAGNGVNSAAVTYESQTDFAYAHWQAGTPAFYTVAGLGAPSGDWFHDTSGFVASVGFGSRTRAFGLIIDLDVSAAQAIGVLPYSSFDPSGDWGAWEGWSMIEPYPSVRLMAGLPIGRHLQIVGGVKADIDADSLGERVPEALKAGESWRGSVFGESLTAYYKWFFGIKF